MEPRVFQIRPETDAVFLMAQSTDMTVNLLQLNQIKQKTVLAIGAHPDDLEYAAGITLTQLSRQNQVHLVVATDGRWGSHQLNYDQQQLINARMQEARQAADAMQAQSIKFWHYPDLQLARYAKQLKRRVLKTLLKLRPQIVISFDPWGRYEPYIHPDHRTLAVTVMEAVMLATLPAWLKKHKLPHQALSPKPKLWLMLPAQANAAVDISHHWPDKLALMQLFASQFDDDTQWNHTDRMKAVFAQMGKLAGVELAENFHIIHS